MVPWHYTWMTLYHPTPWYQLDAHDHQEITKHSGLSYLECHHIFLCSPPGYYVESSQTYVMFTTSRWIEVITQSGRTHTLQRMLYLGLYIQPSAELGQMVLIPSWTYGHFEFVQMHFHRLIHRQSSPTTTVTAVTKEPRSINVKMFPLTIVTLTVDQCLQPKGDQGAGPSGQVGAHGARRL